MAVNFIYGGPSKPSCRRKLKLDNREVNLVFKHSVEPLRWSETPITFDRRDHWVHLPRPGAYPLMVSPVVSQVRLAKVLVDGGSTLDIIFASTLESMGYDMTSLVPSDQAFYASSPKPGRLRSAGPPCRSLSAPARTTAPSTSTSRSPSSRPPTRVRPRTLSSPTPWNDLETRFLLAR